jgi:hypothetical protein
MAVFGVELIERKELVTSCWYLAFPCPGKYGAREKVNGFAVNFKT